MRRSAITRVSKAREGTSSAAAYLVLDAHMCAAVNFGFALQKVTASEFMGTNVGSW